MSSAKPIIMVFGLVVLLMVGFLGVPSAANAPGAAAALASGFWGTPSAVHQFCEPKYATSHFVAEFYNSMSSF
eukprot:6481907-Prymnesium_polylepis.1